jgi:hypothetical protein
MFTDMRDRLHNALLKLEERGQDVQRLEQRNAYLEGELKLQTQQRDFPYWAVMRHQVGSVPEADTDHSPRLAVRVIRRNGRNSGGANGYLACL